MERGVGLGRAHARGGAAEAGGRRGRGGQEARLYHARLLQGELGQQRS